MAKHAAPRSSRGPRRGPAKVKALLSLGLLVGIAAPGTFAFWSDSATVQGGEFTSGTLDLRLHEGAEPEPAYTMGSLTNMVPGESFAASLPVVNAGSVPFTYTVAAVGSGDLGTHLTYTAHVGGHAKNAGTTFRTGQCEGQQAGDTTNFFLARALAPKGTEPVCFVVTLAPDTPSAMQGKSGSVAFTFTADQLVAP